MDRHELDVAIDDAHEKYQPINEGQVATYIPELGKANPDLFGIALARGLVHCTGKQVLWAEGIGAGSPPVAESGIPASPGMKLREVR